MNGSRIGLICGFPQVATRFFSDKTTSLMGASLQRLEGIASHRVFAKSLKSLTIEDECHKVDPCVEDRALDSSEIWPRDDYLYVLSDQIGVRSLQRMLRLRLISPIIIKVRSYMMFFQSLELCSEYVQRQYNYDHEAKRFTPAAMVAHKLALDIFDETRVAISSIYERPIEWPYLDENHCYITANNLTEPKRWQIIFSIAEPQPAIVSEFSALCSADVLDRGIHLVQPILNAPNLETLTIIANDRETIEHMATISLGGLTRLTYLELLNAKLTVSELAHLMSSLRLKSLKMSYPSILAINPRALSGCDTPLEHDSQGARDMKQEVLGMLENTRSALVKLDLYMVYLGNFISWRELLASLGRSVPILENFHLDGMWTVCHYDDDDSFDSMHYDYLRRDMLPSECTGRLTITTAYNAIRSTTVEYTRAGAGLALECIGGHIASFTE